MIAAAALLDCRGGGICGDECPNRNKIDPTGCTGPPTGPSVVSCLICAGHDGECPECHGLNRVEIAGCPRLRITKDHEAAVHAALQMEAGILPVAGAWLDQSATFVDAFPVLRNEVAHWRNVAAKHAKD